MYVLKIDTSKNELIVGEEKELYKKELYTDKVNFVLPVEIKEKMEVKAKIRYAAKEAEATMYKLKDNKIKLEFKEPQRAITSGQSVVMYLDDAVLRWRYNRVILI